MPTATKDKPKTKASAKEEPAKKSKKTTAVAEEETPKASKKATAKSNGKVAAKADAKKSTKGKAEAKTSAKASTNGKVKSKKKGDTSITARSVVLEVLRKGVPRADVKKRAKALAEEKGAEVSFATFDVGYFLKHLEGKGYRIKEEGKNVRVIAPKS